MIFLRRSFVLPLWRDGRAGLPRFQKGASVPKGMSRNVQGLHDLLSERQRYGCYKTAEGIDWTLLSCCRNICPLLLGDGRGLLQRPWPQRAPHLHLQRGPLQLLRGGGGRGGVAGVQDAADGQAAAERRGAASGERWMFGKSAGGSLGPSSLLLQYMHTKVLNRRRRLQQPDSLRVLPQLRVFQMPSPLPPDLLLWYFL